MNPGCGSDRVAPVLEDFIPNIFNKARIIPKVVKPCFQITCPVAVYHEVSSMLLLLAESQSVVVKLELPRIASSTHLWRCDTSYRGGSWSV